MRYIRFFMLFLLVSIYFSTGWAKSSPATQNEWTPIAGKICYALRQASQSYQRGQLEAAQLHTMTAYFKIYDAELEPTIRLNVGPKRVFNTEQAFSHLIKLMHPNPNLKQVKKVNVAAKNLCQRIAEEAKILTDARVARTNFHADA